MEYFLIVVEGAHDAALIGALIVKRGFRKIQLLRDVDPFWKPLIPTKFPSNPHERLDHVVQFPDVYIHPANSGQSAAISSSGGYNKLMDQLQADLNQLPIQGLAGVAIVADADNIDPVLRFAEIRERIGTVNQEGIDNRRDGFPLTLPDASGGIADGQPRLGVYVLPDNVSPGTLETLLLECSASSYQPWHQPSIDFVEQFDTEYPNAPEFKELRKPSGKSKAAANILGNLLVHPGQSLAVNIRDGAWFNNLQGSEQGIQALNTFLTVFLGRNPGTSP
jgi:hypothetical protein